jgi:hypothetical protein
MTAAPRTLPIRVSPFPGEALDSWHEALAARLHATLADLTAAMFPARLPGKTRPASAIMVADSDAAAITASCQIAAADVHALTLARYDGIALRLDRQSARVVRNVLWGRPSGSRFCPQCLAQTGGRWQLSWRLGWSFACLDHGRLLADACPECGRIQRLQPHLLTRVPRPGTCAGPAPQATGVSAPRCGADLTAARTLTLAPGHPVLAAQRFVNGIIAAGQAAAGVYQTSPQPAHAALTDIRALAATILCASSPANLAAALPADIAAEYAAAVARCRRTNATAAPRPPPAPSRERWHPPAPPSPRPLSPLRPARCHPRTRAGPPAACAGCSAPKNPDHGTAPAPRVPHSRPSGSAPSARRRNRPPPGLPQRSPGHGKCRPCSGSRGRSGCCRTCQCRCTG